MNEVEARICLFASIEGGTAFWSNEILARGPLETHDRIVNGRYDPIKYEKLASRIKSCNTDSLFASIAKADGVFLTPEDSEWPISLDDLAVPPIALVIKGNVKVLTKKSIAIVGTRNPTQYGARNAGDFAAGFVDREWSVISGGAYGIDSYAHKGALAAEGISVAVIASGIDINYPAGNLRLFDEILENGAIVSEVMPGCKALPARFLTRNRLIAALSQATLVVEAAFRSGSLRTARDAAELMRLVMAIPGPINSPTSDGCHRLIGERVAEIVTSLSDAVELLSTFK